MIDLLRAIFPPHATMIKRGADAVSFVYPSPPSGVEPRGVTVSIGTPKQFKHIDKLVAAQ